MSKIKLNSWDGLKKFRGEIINEAAASTDAYTIAVGMGTCGVAAGGDVVMAALKDEIQKLGVKNVSVVPTGCYGFCYAEPMVEVHTPGQRGIKYGYVDDKIARVIIRKHIIGGELLDKAIIGQEVQRP